MQVVLFVLVDFQSVALLGALLREYDLLLFWNVVQDHSVALREVEGVYDVVFGAVN